ncbi:3-isopropylmalate dehydratase [Limnohabitans sp. Rim11]|jgi:3-isopropylmalate/(R)-2-methylmalate dehydratase small subunit|uniref:LeuD/DmdB family oxidoreductase small subunit n=1 Tax=Limnohabitans sp. Rim11 TaxID=1100719 RepID=UPI000B0B107F|nr:3-isopropylmalate dehydratase [Limnohabitans sp. Rim11]
MSALHKVWRVGADVDTDQLAPGAYMKLGIHDIAKHCLEGVRPEFAGGVKAGDVVAAGPNFGIGSSREQAADALVKLGVKAVIAPSYSGLYFRNAFNLGLLLLTCKEAELLEEAEQVSLDLKQWAVVRGNGQRLACDPIPDFLVSMVEAGGLLPQLKLRLEQQKASS